MIIAISLLFFYSEGCDVLTVVVASLITAFLVSSIIIFIVGFVCGQSVVETLRGPLIKHLDLVHTLQKASRFLSMSQIPHNVMRNKLLSWKKMRLNRYGPVSVS